MNTNTQIQNDSTNKNELQSLSQLIPPMRAKIAEANKNRIKTDSFFLPTLSPHMLYTVVGTTNAGKTYFSLGTAVSLAKEGKKIGYITTEDTSQDLVEHLENLDADNDALARIFPLYLEDVSADNFRKVLQVLVAQGCDVIIIDYLRPDLLQEHTGDLNYTMGKIFKIIRGQIEQLNVAIIATIQANAALYQQDIGSLIEKNPNKLFTMIDGGYTASKRSHVLALLVKNNNGKKGIVLLKAKHPYNKEIGNVYEYGEVNDMDFSIRYEKPRSYEGWSSNTFNSNSSRDIEVTKSSIGKYVKVRGK